MISSGPSLPILPLQAGQSTKQRRPKNRWSVLVHAVRMVLLGLTVISAHQAHHVRVAKERKPVENESLLSFARSVWPSADRCLANSSDELLTDVVDSSNALVGKLAQTSPLADSIVGYAGPSNLMIAISPEQIVQRVAIAHSADTAEHVLKVENDAVFWQQFEGLAWPTPDTLSDQAMNEDRADGVSGATLTSLAIAESILWRIDAARFNDLPASSTPDSRVSLKFSEALRQDEAMQLAVEAAKQFPEQWDAQRIELKIISSWEAMVVNSDGQTVGRVLRSGPLADQILGYQGPSEVLLVLDQDQNLLTASFRGTYDNEPYTRYVREETGFWSKFAGRSVTSIASIDLNAEGIEGVSGATMTSQAVAETIRETCQRLVELNSHDETQVAAERKQSSSRTRRLNLSATELFTISLSLLAIPWSLSRLRGKPAVRLAWQAVCFVGVGWVSGNLLSLALFNGWIQGGVPWQLAPGLTVLLVVAFCSNLLLKRNVYCDHLCPHGIAQQWLRRTRRVISNRSTSNRPISKSVVWLERLLSASGVLAILGVAFSFIVGHTMPVAWLEPFDTYVWRIGLTWSAAVWLASLVISYFRPMAYCRHACPTGKILEYTRFNPKRSVITLVDFAIVLAWLGLVTSS